MNLERAIGILKEARDKKRFVFIMGNGGSASMADHFACDLMKVAKIKAMSLCSNMAVFSAYANDVSYKEVFTEQLKVLAEPGDVVIGISSSGNSANVLDAIEWANNNDIVTIGMAGFDCGRLGTIAKCVVLVVGSSIPEVEDYFSETCHILAHHVNGDFDD